MTTTWYVAEAALTLLRALEIEQDEVRGTSEGYLHAVGLPSLRGEVAEAWAVVRPVLEHGWGGALSSTERGE